jgi:processive 1,2-diacylglycerol beta-glucosyltransferase
MKVLILSISAGLGHEKAAMAIKDYMENSTVNCTVYVVDVFKYIHPLIDKIIVGGYLQTIKNMPHLYGKLYNASENEELAGNLTRMVNDVLYQKLGELINLTRPDVIIATHPFHVEMICALKKNIEINIPVVAVITDFAPHSLWVYGYVDAYVLPAGDLKDEFILKGVDEKKIYPYGIPVSRQFLEITDKRAVLSELGFDEKPTVLLMGGGLGLGGIKGIFKTLMQSSLDIQIIAVTGNNTKLKRQIEYLSREGCHKVRIYGFTDKIPDFMAISDILITKPGGLSVSEALIKGLPIVIISPIPGQEERNANYPSSAER